MPAFLATCRERLQQVIPPAHPHPVRVFSQDDSRFGLLPIRWRRLTARGIQPVGPVQHMVAWCYVDGAVAPITGDRFLLARPSLNAEGFHLFGDAFAQAFPASLTILVLDNSGAHTTQRLHLPTNGRLVFLSPSCPALDPPGARLA